MPTCYKVYSQKITTVLSSSVEITAAKATSYSWLLTYQITTPKHGGFNAQKYTWIPIWILLLDILLYGMELSYFSVFFSTLSFQSSKPTFYWGTWEKDS